MCVSACAHVHVNMCLRCVCVDTRTLSTVECMIECSWGMCGNAERCIFRTGKYLIRRGSCQLVHVVCVFWRRVSVCNQGKACAWVVCVLPLHLGEDMCKYVCDSLSVCDQVINT